MGKVSSSLASKHHNETVPAIQCSFDYLNSFPRDGLYPFPGMFISNPVEPTEAPKDPGSKEPTDTRPARQM